MGGFKESGLIEARRFFFFFLIGYNLTSHKCITVALPILQQPLSRQLNLPCRQALRAPALADTDGQSIRMQLKLLLGVVECTGTVCRLIDARQSSRTQVLITSSFSPPPNQPTSLRAFKKFGGEGEGGRGR